MQIFGVNHSSANAHMLLPLKECAMDEKWMRHMVHSAVTRQVNFVFHLPACGRATEHTNAPSTRRNNPKFEYGIRDIPTFRSLGPQERKIAHPCLSHLKNKLIWRSAPIRGHIDQPAESAAQPHSPSLLLPSYSKGCGLINFQRM